MKKVSLLFAISIFLLSGIFTSCPIDNSETHGDTPGVVLSFDDYSPDSWEPLFDLFDEYNAKVTFFVNKSSVTPFMLNAQDRGHEIGFHSINHPVLYTLEWDDFHEETIAPISAFRDGGVELTSFAYPYGEFEPWMHYELLKHYKIIRGAYNFKRYSREEMRSGFIHARSVDNLNFETDEIFENQINTMLISAKEFGKIINLYSHNITTARWGITEDRVEYILKKGTELGLKFYTYKDFQ